MDIGATTPYLQRSHGAYGTGYLWLTQRGATRGDRAKRSSIRTSRSLRLEAARKSLSTVFASKSAGSTLRRRSWKAATNVARFSRLCSLHSGRQARKTGG